VYDECQTFYVEGEVTVTVIEPVANFEMISGLTFEDLPVTFQNLSSGAVTYEWDFGDGQRSDLTHPSNTYDLPGQYEVTLIATNDLGCKDTVSKIITIQEEYWVYVPNTFTPDGNEFNNTFFASTIKIKELTIWIFNRWGENVFKSNDVHFIWDGTYEGFLVPDGTYTYKIRYLTNSGIEETIVGHINVLR
jgi:gliding motility-associated-like protein